MGEICEIQTKCLDDTGGGSKECDFHQIFIDMEGKYDAYDFSKGDA